MQFLILRREINGITSKWHEVIGHGRKYVQDEGTEVKGRRVRCRISNYSGVSFKNTLIQPQ